eukprot:GFYU01000988.1.p1 GENE.GFYU01000988.1~~GFYU01000988.1.p1  ORF type:complete len:477 (-),score=147.53 GFYU01000988.1:51-1481(-)
MIGFSLFMANNIIREATTNSKEIEHVKVPLMPSDWLPVPAESPELAELRNATLRATLKASPAASVTRPRVSASTLTAKGLRKTHTSPDVMQLLQKAGIAGLGDDSAAVETLPRRHSAETLPLPASVAFDGSAPLGIGMATTQPLNGTDTDITNTTSEGAGADDFVLENVTASTEDDLTAAAGESSSDGERASSPHLAVHAHPTLGADVDDGSSRAKRRRTEPGMAVGVPAETLNAQARRVAKTVRMIGNDGERTYCGPSLFGTRGGTPAVVPTAKAEPVATVRRTSFKASTAGAATPKMQANVPPALNTNIDISNIQPAPAGEAAFLNPLTKTQSTEVLFNLLFDDDDSTTNANANAARSRGAGGGEGEHQHQLGSGFDLKFEMDDDAFSTGSSDNHTQGAHTPQLLSPEVETRYLADGDACVAGDDFALLDDSESADIDDDVDVSALGYDALVKDEFGFTKGSISHTTAILTSLC